MSNPTSPAAAERELVRRLQHFHNDNVVDGIPCGDWHVECAPDHAAMLIRQHVAAEVARETAELRKDSERLSWLQDHADEIEIRFFTSDALHYYAQEFMNGKHTVLRWCIDQAMKATAHKSSPPPPAS